ncbi:MAG: hypothetical protein M1828_007549 [Chrysothrix sp. TS-e1954]|nr:MAG: hypothetical protein M1828_007549 [Chrysothrix sp. TS-e1954]
MDAQSTALMSYLPPSPSSEQPHPLTINTRMNRGSMIPRPTGQKPRNARRVFSRPEEGSVPSAGMAIAAAEILAGEADESDSDVQAVYRILSGITTDVDRIENASDRIHAGRPTSKRSTAGVDRELRRAESRLASIDRALALCDAALAPKSESSQELQVDGERDIDFDELPKEEVEKFYEDSWFAHSTYGLHPPKPSASSSELDFDFDLRIWGKVPRITVTLADPPPQARAEVSMPVNEGRKKYWIVQDDAIVRYWTDAKKRFLKVPPFAFKKEVRIAPSADNDGSWRCKTRADERFLALKRQTWKCYYVVERNMHPWEHTDGFDIESMRKCLLLKCLCRYRHHKRAETEEREKKAWFESLVELPG